MMLVKCAVDLGDVALVVVIIQQTKVPIASRNHTANTSMQTRAEWHSNLKQRINVEIKAEIISNRRISEGQNAQFFNVTEGIAPMVFETGDLTRPERICVDYVCAIIRRSKKVAFVLHHDPFIIA